MNHATGQVGLSPQLSAVKVSPLDERISSLGGNIGSLESEVESLCKQLQPITLSGPSKEGSTNATPNPPESSVEIAIRGFDDRIVTLWHILSALRAQLRV